MPSHLLSGAVVMAVHRPAWDLLERQVRSIQAQTVREWTCLVGIDGSDEATRELVVRLVGDDHRFEIRQFEPNLGVFLHFERLFRLLPAEAAWVAMADQDDYWYETKFERLLPVLAQEGVLAVSGQARVVRRDGTVLGRTHRRAGSLLSTLMVNQLTGSMAIVRREVIERSLPFPAARSDHAIHDHWLAVCATAEGRIEVLGEVLQDYLQHENNVIGEVEESRLGDVARLLLRQRRLSQITDDLVRRRWAWRVAMAQALEARRPAAGVPPWLRAVARGRTRLSIPWLLVKEMRASRLTPMQALWALLASGLWTLGLRSPVKDDR